MGNDIGAQQNYQRSVLEAIDTVVQRRINGLKLDKTITAIIDKNIGMSGGYPLYQVKYEGGTFVATARDSSETYARNTAVYVTVPQSDFSKEKFIIGKASSMSSMTAESTSVSSEINKYVKLGPNLIDEDSIFGLRSYHSLDEEDEDSNSILHRARFLYNVDDNSNNHLDISQDLFNIYKEEATNILFRADFRTNLDIIQQRSAGGRYGLALTLTFSNPNAGYGQTQGEVLDNLGKIIIGNAKKITSTKENAAFTIDVKTNTTIPSTGWVGISETDIDNISLKEWDQRLQLFFNSSDANDESVSYWQQDGLGLFDCYSQYIQTIYQTFCVNNSSSQSIATDNLVAAYLNLLADLKKLPANLEEIKTYYNNWKSTSIGDLSDIDEIIYLTSDSMMGNPLAFKNWNSQYIIPSQKLEFSRFKYIKNILFFKDGFNQDAEQEQLWPPSDAPKDEGTGYDIFCQNIQLFLLKESDAESNNFSLKVECAENSTGVLSSLSADDKVTFNAHVYRNQIEELTSNANVEYIWLKQSSQVINASHPDYYHYAGIGWKRLKNTSRFIFQTTGNENWAYKNLYKCIALYKTSDETVTLSTTFTVYNNAVSTKIKLESDLGTEFTFSEGSPTISCLIQENSLSVEDNENLDNYQEYGYNDSIETPLYKYQWSIADSANSSVLFLEDAFSKNTSNILKDNIVSKIKMWYLDRTTNELVETKIPNRATRIQYPVSLSSSGFTVECTVQKIFISETTANYYDIGTDSIEITNLKMGASSNYRIIIENGDQVFQYDEYGNAPTLTKTKDPLEIKPLHAKILGPTGLSFSVSSSNINFEWIFNLENSLIIPPDGLVLNPATQQEQLLKGPDCTFDIEKLYNPDAQNNQITCHANFNDIDLYADTNFYFNKIGGNGTNGTDMISKISYNGNDKYFVLHEQPLTLYVQKNVPIDENTTETQAMFNVADSDGDIDVLKNKQTIVTNAENKNSVLKAHVYQKGEEIDSVNFASGYPRWILAGNSRGNELGKYFEITANEIKWNPNYHNDTRSLLLQNIRSEILIKNKDAITEEESEQTYYSFFSLPIIEYENNSTLVNELLPMQRIAIDKKTYLNDVVYNADGRNPIFNHNQGLKLTNLPENSIIYWEARGGLDVNKSNNSNIIQECFELEPSFTLGLEKNTKNTFSKLISQRKSTLEKEEEQRRQVYEKEKDENLKLYCTLAVDEQGNEILDEEGNKVITGGTGLYDNYIAKVQSQNELLLAKFKEERLRILQKEAINKFIEEELPHRTDLTENDIRDKEREDKPLNECWWFSKNVNEWWDSQAVYKNYFYKITTQVENEQGESQLIEKYYPLPIWEESRYQLTTESEKENELYNLYKYVIVNEQDNEYGYVALEKSEIGEQDYFYKTIYTKANVALTPEAYFKSVYSPYEEAIIDANIQILNDDTNEAMIYVLPNDVYDGSVTNNRIEAKIYIPDSDEEIKLYATVYAPINMTLNTFGLDSVNAWDGNSISIDDERGAILAPQVGAGEKDSNNRFTGILMGKTNTYTGSSSEENQIGLFGYSYGIQSIFLDAKTGNADFGLPNGNSIQTDEKGNYIGLKNDDYNEGRIELRPGGVSKIGGWRLGHRSLYYTQSGEIGPRYSNDYVPEIRTGKITQIGSDPYSGHHEKDIDYKDSGILLHSGTDPYISIKGRQLLETDIAPDDLGIYLRPEDSLEIQLDPKTPTLFTIFRHNGTNWTQSSRNSNGEITTRTIYEEGSRTYLAGINGKGEFVANTVSSIVNIGENEDSVYTTQFSVNTFRAFDDFAKNLNVTPPIPMDFPTHTGLKIKIGSNTIGQLFVSNDGINPNSGGDSTLFITGGLGNNNEYTRPIGIYGKNIKLASNPTFSSAEDPKNSKKTDTYLLLGADNDYSENKDGLQIQVKKAHFNLFKDDNYESSLMSAGNFKTNIGLEQKAGQNIVIYTTNNKTVNMQSNPKIYISITVGTDENGNSTTVYAEKDSWDKNDLYVKINSTDYKKATTIPFYYQINNNNNNTNYYCLVSNQNIKYYKINNSIYLAENDPTYDLEISDTGEESYVITTKSIAIDQYFYDNIKEKFIKITAIEKDSNNNPDAKYRSVVRVDNNELIDTFVANNLNTSSLYFWTGSSMKKYDDSLKEYNVVRGMNGVFYYINKNDLVYSELNPGYIYKDSEKRQYVQITGSIEPIESVKYVSTENFISQKDYSFYAGKYYGKIVTNRTELFDDNNTSIGYEDDIIELIGDSNGIQLFNSTGGGISIISQAKTFTDFDVQLQTINEDEKVNRRFGFFTDEGYKLEGQSLIAGFLIDTNNYNGLSMTQSNIGLNAESNILLKMQDNFEVNVSSLGEGNLYTESNPQILLKAGPSITGNSGTSAELILNSSNNGWASALSNNADFKNNNPKKAASSYPVFEVRTATARIGIYPEHYTAGDTRQYRENFYVTAPQYNSNGLSVQGGLLKNPSVGLSVNKNVIFGGTLTVGKQILVRKGNITTKEGNIVTKKGNITTNKGNITTKEGDIATNKGNITVTKAGGIGGDITADGAIKGATLHGDGTAVTNTASGTTNSFSISKYNGTFTLHGTNITLTNERPVFSAISDQTFTISKSDISWGDNGFAGEVALAVKGDTTTGWGDWVKKLITGDTKTDWSTWIKNKIGSTTYAAHGHTHTVDAYSKEFSVTNNKVTVSIPSSTTSTD